MPRGNPVIYDMCHIRLSISFRLWLYDTNDLFEFVLSQSDVDLPKIGLGTQHTI